jgi:predicted hotdog family 3-hydroxylacyl-ACP dehydratase
MTTEYSVEELVPHSGKMSLLTEITGYGDDWLSAQVEITEHSMFADKRGVPSWVGLEYLAQAIGAYAGLKERRKGERPKLGFLLGTRKYSCDSDYFVPGDVLTLKVVCNLQGENGLSAFDCVLQGNGCQANASLNVFQPDDAEKFFKEASL